MSTAKADEGLVVEGLSKQFISGGGLLGPPRQTNQAVRGVDLSVPPRHTLGLVGESGCGKSTVSRCILRLVEPDAGTIKYEGEDLRKATPARMQALRRRMQIVFQDPYASLNPRRLIGLTLAEPLVVHGLARWPEALERARAMLAEVGLDGDACDRFPHEFSGGQRQRIGIARALILGPSLLIADEPVSALDVSVQAQVLNLMTRLRDQRELSVLFVSHDLGVVRHFCDFVVVMYLGRIVESGQTDRLFATPLHPYTQLLIDSAPVPDPARRRRISLVSGEVAGVAAQEQGCPFRSRCPSALPLCGEARPELRDIGEGRKVACHLHA